MCKRFKMHWSMLCAAFVTANAPLACFAAILYEGLSTSITVVVAILCWCVASNIAIISICIGWTTKRLLIFTLCVCLLLALRIPRWRETQNVLGVLAQLRQQRLVLYDDGNVKYCGIWWNRRPKRGDFFLQGTSSQLEEHLHQIRSLGLKHVSIDIPSQAHMSVSRLEQLAQLKMRVVVLRASGEIQDVSECDRLSACVLQLKGLVTLDLDIFRVASVEVAAGASGRTTRPTYRPFVLSSEAEIRSIAKLFEHPSIREMDLLFIPGSLSMDFMNVVRPNCQVESLVLGTVELDSDIRHAWKRFPQLKALTLLTAERLQKASLDQLGACSSLRQVAISIHNYPPGVIEAFCKSYGYTPVQAKFYSTLAFSRANTSTSPHAHPHPLPASH